MGIRAQSKVTKNGNKGVPHMPSIGEDNAKRVNMFPIKLVTNSCFCLSFAIHLHWLGIWGVGCIANPSHIFPVVASSGYSGSPFVDYWVCVGEVGQEGSDIQASVDYVFLSTGSFCLG